MAGTTPPPNPRGVGPLRVDHAHDGSLTYLVDRPAAALPPVRSRDIAAAWDAARAAAIGATFGAPFEDRRRFCFRASDGTITELALFDRDARCWAAAVERTTGLHSLYGLSLCLRLLALVDLLANARWTNDLCTLRRDGAELHPALLRAAAETELTNDARFDEKRLRAGLAALHPSSAPRPTPPGAHP